MDLSQLKWKLIVATVFGILLGIIVILAVVLLSTESKENQCLFGKVEPSASKWTENIASSDLKALASFSGYIQTSSDPHGRYLPLKLFEVSYSSKNNSTKERELILQTNCAKITIVIFQEGDDSFDVNSIEVSLNRPVASINNGSRGTWTDCEIYYPSMFFAKYEGYGCEKKTVFDCLTRRVDQAALVIETIKFEIDGDSEKFKAGEFSKPTRYCIQ